MAINTLPDITPESRAIAKRAEARRMALQGEQSVLRQRYEAIMRWVNPPWDPLSQVIDPRPELASPERGGRTLLHVDLVASSLTRWASLKAGAMPIFRVQPPWVAPVVETGDPQEDARRYKQYDLDRAIAQGLSSGMENTITEWVEANNFHRTLLWSAWASEAFGKAVLKSGWDPVEGIPTVELLEDPSKVYYAWTKRYGNRKLAWVLLVDQMDIGEANARYGIDLPTTELGVDYGRWTSTTDDADYDVRPEQQASVNRMVTVMEYWELLHGEKTRCQYALIVGGRVINGPYVYPWQRLPYHVLENEHIPTWSHGKSTAESLIPINMAYDDLLDRQQQVIEFESGPRYKGLNMANSDEVDIPSAFEMLPLREGEDIQQIDTRVDFWPSQVHAEELRQAKYRATGLTPIAEGMSPNAQTSGRAMSAEWRAVELPLASRLITMTPELRDLLICWWDYAEAYSPDAKKLAKGYRRFKVLWEPLDIRDKTERVLDVVQRYNANLVDLETALEETGYENVDEMVSKIRSYLVDPIFNPLRYQQYLTLQQLEITIQQMRMQTEQMAAETQGSQLQAQGAGAAAQAAAVPGGPVTEGQNQPGASPNFGGLPLETSILSQTPLQGGIGNRAIVPLSSTPR